MANIEKKKMSFTVGKLEFSEEKGSFSGYINGQYCIMKQSQKGEWFLQAYVDVAFFEPRQSNQSTQQEEDPFR